MKKGNPLGNSHITVLCFDWLSSHVPGMRRYAISHDRKREIPISPFSTLIGAHRVSRACADTQAGNMGFITRVRRLVIWDFYLEKILTRDMGFIQWVIDQSGYWIHQLSHGNNNNKNAQCHLNFLAKFYFIFFICFPSCAVIVWQSIYTSSNTACFSLFPQLVPPVVVA